MDAAASWLKPQSVIESETNFLQKSYANAGRGVCKRATDVDDMVADVRTDVANFMNANLDNVVFTAGATDSLNRIVHIIKNSIDIEKPVVAVSDLDHHSARLPWVMSDCETVVVPLDANHNIDINQIPKCDVFVITAMSNVMGVAQDVKNIIKIAKQKNPNVITVVDAAQYVAHCRIDVIDIDCDFLVWSGHKIGSDTGIGVMYVRDVEKYSPDKFGGGMVNRIMDDKVIFNNASQKFEAGTLPLTQIIGLKSAISELQKWDGGHDLIKFMYDELSNIKSIRLLTSRDASMLSFVIDGMHALDFGVMVGAHDICLRVGNMCASWLMKNLDIDGCARISVGPWNTMDDARYVIDVIKKIVK